MDNCEKERAKGLAEVAEMLENNAISVIKDHVHPYKPELAMAMAMVAISLRLAHITEVVERGLEGIDHSIWNR